MAYETEQYRFRISGEDYTGYTRMVEGQQQQWVRSCCGRRRCDSVRKHRWRFGQKTWNDLGAA